MSVIINVKLKYMLVLINMNEEKIYDALRRSNKWWSGPFEVDFKPRTIYAQIKRFFPTRQIIALAGLRRTGKTTIMLKLIEDALRELPKENILYFSFDDFRDVRLQQILKSYERLLKKELTKEHYLILFDEIQKIDNWQEQLKRIYDENQNIKFVISGSESLFIRKKSKESLAGRLYEFQIKTLRFNEYLAFIGKSYEHIPLHKEEILREFSSFILCNGFPELIHEPAEIAIKYVNENIIQRILYLDIPQLFPVESPAILEQVFRIIMENPGQLLNLAELGSELGIARQTAALYVEYLEKSFLIRKLYNYSGNARKTQRKLKKYYPTIISPEYPDGLFGRVFESVLVNHLDSEYFWRDSFQNEVDVILPDPLTGIEIKSGEPRERDTRCLEKFSKKYKPEKSLILSYDRKLTFGKIDVIPFYEYILAPLSVSS